jgi:hypothetical protein
MRYNDPLACRSAYNVFGCKLPGLRNTDSLARYVAN